MMSEPLEDFDSYRAERAEEEKITPYTKVCSFSTVGELRKALEIFTDGVPIGFINQPKQDLYLRIDLEYGSDLGFQ